MSRSHSVQKQAQLITLSDPMKNQYKQMPIGLLKKTAFFLLALFAFGSLHAQFNTPTVNGAIAVNEYGTHTDGQNQQTNGGQVWYMTWDNTNLFIGLTGANTAEGAVAYFDIDVLAPIDGGTTATNGTAIGNNYDGTNFANLPFKADLVIYFKNGYREVRTRTGSNTWSAANTTFGSYNETAGTNREVAIPWSVFPGAARPAQFAWFGYVTSAGGSVYGTVPTANATGTIGTGARYERYFKVDNTANTTSIKPFSRDSYVFNSTFDNNTFGAISVWDFTMNTAGRQISRGTTGGNWNINGTLLINAGSVFFGSPAAGPFGTSTVANVIVNSGSALDMDQTNQPLTVSGNFFTSGIFNMSQQIGGDLNVAGNFTHSAGGSVNATGTRARLINFNGTTAQAFQSLGTGTNLSFVTISNTANTVTHTIGATTIANTLTINEGAKLTLQTSGSLTINAGANFNINGTTAATTFTVTTPATCTVTGTMTRNNPAAVITSTAAVLSFSASTGTYNHAVNGSVLPTATWNATSTCNITGITTTNPTGLSGTFGSLTWNNTGQTSATGVISGALTVNGNLSVLAGTLSDGGLVITGNATGLLNVANGATLQFGIGGATTTNFPANFTTANTTLGATSNIVYNTTSPVTISAMPSSYGSLTLSGNSVKTLGAAKTFNRNITVNAGTFADGGFQITGNGTGTFSLAAGTFLQIGAATATITSFPTLFPTANISLAPTSTVTYTTITNAQTVAGNVAGVGPGTYGNLIITGISGQKTASGPFTVAGNLTLNTSALLADGGNTLTVNGNITNSGTHSGAGNITIAGGIAAHSISSAVNCTYGNLVFNDGSFATTITNTGALNPTNTTIASINIQRGVLNIGSMVTSGAGGLIVSGLTTVGDGTNASTFVHTAAGGTRNYTGGITINNLGVFNNTTGPAGNNVGDITVNTGGIWNNSNNSTWAVTGNVTNNGTFTSGSGTYTLSGTARTINGTIQFTGISMSGTYTNNGNVTVLSTFNGGGTLTQAANSNLNVSASSIFPNLNATANPNLVRYFGAAGVTVKNTTYHNLHIDMNSGIAATVGTSAVTVNNNLNVSGGIFADGGFQTVGNATGTLAVANGATMQFGAAGATTSNFPTNFTTVNVTLNPTSTVIYNTTSAVNITTVPSLFGNLTLSGVSTKTLTGAETLQGNLVINAGSLADGGNILTVNGNITNAGTHTGTGRILLTGGTAAHALTGTGSYTNLELDDTQGATAGASFSILGVLTQTTGTFTINAGFALTLGAGSSLAATGTGNFGGTTTSNLSILGTGNLGNTLRFASGAQNLGLLTINRTPSGVVNLGSDLNLNAATALTLTNGLLYLGSNTITLSGTSFTSGGSVTAMVVADGTGELRKIFNTGATTIFTFPIGDVSGLAGVAPNNNNPGADYSPVAITMTANNTVRTIGVRVTDSQNSNDATPTNNISRFWSFSDSQAGVGTYTYTGTFTYSTTAPSDLTGTQTLANINRWNGTSWTELVTTYPGSGFTITGATETSGTLGGNQFAARVNTPQTYTWVATSGSNNWTTPGSWSPARVSPFTSDILQFTNGGTPTATNIPTQSIGRLIIQGTDATFTSAAATQTLTISNTTGTNFIVDNSSTLRLSSTAANSTIIAFLGTNVTDIAGLIEINANTGTNNTINFTNLLAVNNIIAGTITNNGGVVTSTAASTTFGATGVYNHARNGGAIPLATWNATSLCNITGVANTALTAFTGVFGNLTWNCASQSIATPLTAASSVNGSLNVSAGSFSDGSFQITGNASGTLSVAAGATLQIGTGGTGTVFPTLFTSISLAAGTPGSTVVYGSSAAQNVAALTYHNLTLQSSGAKTALGAITVNRNLAITGCQFNDGGFQITGNATGTFTMSAAAGSILVLGNAATATAFPTNFTNANITLSSPSIVRYNSNLNQTVSNVPTYSVLQMQSAAGTPTKILAGNTLVNGSATPMVNIGANNTFNLGGFNLTLTNSGGTSPITNTGIISANTDGGSTIILNGTSHNLALGATSPTNRPNLVINVNSAQTVTVGSSSNVFNISIAANNTLTLQASAVLGIAGTYGNSGTLNANNTGAGFNFNGIAAQNFTVGTYTGSNIGLFQISNSNGVTLNSPLNTTTLTLNNGLLNTTTTNLLTVSGTTAANVTGGSATSYVNGPLALTIPASLVTGSTYRFPIGKSIYNLFELINPTTSAATQVVRAEANDVSSGGSAGLGFDLAPNPARYWDVQRISGTGVFTSAGTVRLTDASMGLAAGNVIGNSTTVNGTYNPLGGNVTAPTIASTTAAPVGLGFYIIGSQGCLTGTYTIGPTGNFPKLTNAIATLNGSLVCADVFFELQPTYDGTTGETFPLTINQLTYSGGPWNVTFRPGSGVSTCTTSGNPGSGINFINLNGANRIIFDGRAGGTGSTIAWLIRNTQTAATFTPTIQFTADASNNTLQYLQLESQNALTTSGTVLFTAGTTTGNDNNTISDCLFSNRGDATTTFPANHIYAVASTSGRENSNISITNNNFRNFYINGSTSSGITVNGNNIDFNITGNSFYQTATLTPTTSTTLQFGISVSGTGTGDINLANNFIGGNAPGATGTWTATATSGIDYRFCGILLSNTLASPASLIDGNTIRNFTISSGSVFQTQYGVFSGIYSQNVGGTISNNIIGSTSAASNIGLTFTGAAALGVVHGIFQDGNGVINITDNAVGGISLANSTSNAIIYNLHGIRASTSSTGSALTITGNTIGSTTVANSLTNATGNTYNSTGNIFTSGIFTNAGNTSSSSNISNNIIANLSYTASGNGTTGSVQVVGIYRQFAPSNTISNNTIYNLNSTSPYVGSNTSASVGGIIVLTTSASNHTLSQNTIHSLSNTTASAAVTVTGIALSTTTTTNTVDRNFIHSLSLNSSSTSAVINGIVAVAGNSNFSNNMIRLGINAAGNNITNPYLINGINEVAGANNFYFNSVFIGGTGVTTGTSATHAFLSSVAAGTRAIQNNILWNARSNNTGTGKHFAIRIGAITGLTISHNDLFVSGTGGILGNIGGTDNTSLSSFGTNNISGDPQFINPIGDNGIITPGTNDVDLHIQPSPTATPIEGTGINIAAVSADFDNESRSSLSPEDMGADAGNFTPIDLTPPTISYAPFAAACNTVSIYTVTATITDAGTGSSVNTTTGTRPRIFFKKSTDANTLAGWQFVEASNISSPFSFDIDFSLLGGVSPGNSIQYFITAQDQGVNVPAPNVAINSGSFATAPTSVALTSTAFPIGGTINSFVIAPCSGTITVGTGGDYPALTTATGVFQAINATTLTGNLTVNVISNITIEDGTHGLNQFAAPHTITIQSDGTARAVSGSYNGANAATNGLIRLNGADRVTFNGGIGNDRLLSFSNTFTGLASWNACFSFLNTSQNNTINNCTLSAGSFGATTTNGVVFIGPSLAGGGNNNNNIQNNDIRNLSVSSFPINGIYADGTGASGSNTSNTIDNNNIFNFYLSGGGGSCGGITIANANTAYTITNNNIFQTINRVSASALDYYFIRIGVNTGTACNGVGFTISGNKLGGTGRDISGNITGTWSESNSGTAHRFYGIMINQSTTTGTATTVENNIVSGLSFTSSSTGGITGSGGGAWNGIAVVSGNVNIGSVGNGNVIGSAASNSSILLEKNSLSGPGNSAAIWVNGANTNVSAIGNSIGGIDISQTSVTDPYSFYGVYYLANNALSKSISNNTIGNTGSNGLIRSLTGANNQNLVGIFSSVGSGALININDNIIAGLDCNGGSLTSGTGRTTGIEITGASTQYSINRNSISNLINRTQLNSNALGDQTVIGIRFVNGSILASTISANTIFGLTNPSTSNTVSICGIYLSGSSSANHQIVRNNIHSFDFVSSSQTANNFGVFLDGTTGGSVINNMIRLGIQSNGTTVPNSTSIQGIYDNSTTGNNIQFNTVYIGGASSSGLTSNTYAYRRNVNSGADNVRNNIFTNARTGGGSSIHYAFASNTLTGITAASLDNNIFHTTGATEFSINNGTSALTGVTAALRMQNLRGQAPIGNNLRSGIATIAQINFINATGNATNVNLRLNNDNCAAGAGVAISGITSDFDGTVTRANPPAIGAHESATFTAIGSGYDIYTPVITVSSVPTLTAACGTSQTITITATITDVGLGLASGALQPTLWWRLSTGTYASLAPSSTSGNNFIYTLNLTGIIAGQTYHYYVAAQDIESPSNIFYSNFNATTPVHADVATAASPLQANPATFVVNATNPLSGTVTVGTSGDYPSFNGVSGLFNAINSRGLSGDLEVLVISNINELANWTPLNAPNEFCGSGYTITVRPNAATSFIIDQPTGAANAVLSFTGARRVVFDGSFSGSGRFLLFRHNRTAAGTTFPSTIEFNNSANNITFRNCIIEGANPNFSNNVNNSSGVVKIGGPMGFASGNINNIVLQNNQIRNISNIAQAAATSPAILVYLGGASSSASINNITITGNDMLNFAQAAVQADNGSSTTTNSIGDNLTITNNQIYQPLSFSTYQYPININALGLSRGHVISNNKIGGNAVPNPNITGTWLNPRADGELVGIYCNVDDAPTQAGGTLIDGNTISNITLSGTGYGNFIGIRVENGRVSVNNNTIGSLASSLTSPNIIMAGNGDIFDLTANSMMAGIWTQSTEEVVIDNNIICGLSNTSGLSFFDGIAHGSNLYFNYTAYQTPGGKATITNNQILFNRSGSQLQSLVLSSEAFMGIFCWTNAANNVISGNKVRNCGSNTAIYNRNVRFHGMFVGVYGSTTAQTGTVSNNEISHLFNENPGDNTNSTSRNPIIYGLSIANGNWTVSNNTIFLNNGTQGGTLFTDRNTSIRGLNDGMLFNQANCQARYYNNSVYVSGSNLTGAGQANSTYAFLRFPLDYSTTSITAGAPIELRNNIFINDRSGLGNHRAIGNIANTNTNAAINWNSSTSNHNFFSTTSTTTNVALWGASTTYTLANWQTLSGGGDANTTHVITTTGASSATQVNPSQLFINVGTGAANLRIIETPPNDPWPYAHVNGNGTPLASVTNDIDNDLRDPATPDKGADEFLLCASPIITTQPASTAICEGLNTSFTVVNSGLAPFTYQWEENQGSGWNALSNGGVYSNVTTATLNLTGVTAGMNNYAYRVVITNACGNVTTDGLAVLTINLPPAITAYSPNGGPSSANFINNVCNGSNTGFGVTATGAGLTYQWQLSTDNGGTWSTTGLASAPYSGSTSSILSINNTPSSFNAYQYRVVITGTCAPVLTSDAGLLNVGAVAIVTNPSVSAVVCENGNTAITVAATGNNLTYQWQLSTNGGGSWNPIGNGGVYSTATTNSLTITGATNSMNNYQYRVIVGTTACTPATSTASVLTVNPLLPATVSIAASPGNSICAGTSVTFTATPTNGGATPIYQWYLNGTPVGTNSNTYTNAALANSNQVYVEMTSNAVCPNPALSISNTITMTVNPTLTPAVSIAALPGISICQSTSVTITPTPTNGGSSPIYEWFLNGVSQGNSPTYVSTTLSNGDQVNAVLTSNALCASPTTGSSNTLTFTVQSIGQWLGNGTNWDTPGNWGCGVVPTNTTNVLIPTNPVNGNIFPEVGSANTSQVLSLLIENSASVTVLTGSDLSVYGNITNNGVASLGAGLIRLRGNALQTIGGASQLAIASLTLDNTATSDPAVELNNSISVSNTLDFIDGNLNLNGFDINLNGTGVFTNETNSSRVYGSSGEVKTVITLSASTNYANIAGLGIGINTGTTAPGVTQIDRGHFQHTHIGTYQSIQRYFDISPTTNTALDATLRMYYFDDEMAVTLGPPAQKANLLPWRSTDGGATWSGQFFPSNLSNDVVNNWVQLTSIPAFSRWTLSDWLLQPLPIELLSFTATANQALNQVDLNWVTASEINNEYFTVERSKDAQLFNPVLVRSGAGNSNSIITYNDVDIQPYTGLSYYRLKQTDYNGAHTYSQIVPVNFSNNQLSTLNGLFIESGDLYLNHFTSNRNAARIEVMDAAGRNIFQGMIQPTEGNNIYQLPASSWSAGIYMVRLIQNGEALPLKVVKTK